MHVAKSFTTLDEALADLRSPSKTDRSDACDFLGDVLERGVFLPNEEQARYRAAAAIATALIDLIGRETDLAVLDDALHALLTVEGDASLPWDVVVAALPKLDPTPCLGYALTILGAVGDARLEPTLRAYLDRRESHIRAAASEGLADLAFRVATFGAPQGEVG